MDCGCCWRGAEEERKHSLHVGWRNLFSASKTIRQKIMWSQFPPNLSRYSCVVVLVLLLWFPPNLSCLQSKQSAAK